MDTDRFENLLRSVSRSPSRRSALRLLAGSVLGGLVTLDRGNAAAHDLSAKCKKKSGKAKKKCLKKAKKHNATHSTQPAAPPPCIGRCTVTKPCGPDGCGGLCGRCTPLETCMNGTCGCIPNCNGKECGPDGCFSSCGDCGAEGSCREDGICICPDEKCRGKCVNRCPGGTVRNPDDCTCCIVNTQECSGDAECCSGTCSPLTIRCEGRRLGASCSFNAQCASGKCEPNCSDTICTIEQFCQPA